jgi:small subunit ribosomal protein S1
MYDKKADTFFDDDQQDKSGDNALMAMLDKYEKPKGLKLKPGMKVTGTINRITTEGIFVDIDGKNQGFLTIRQKDEEKAPDYKIGDKIETFIQSFKDNEIILTNTMSGFSASTSQLSEAMNNRIPVEGKVTGVNKGGLQVKIMGQRGFCPISAIDIKYVEDVNVYLGQNLTFVIERITEGGRNIVVSRLPILEQQLALQLDEIEKGVADKKVYTGTVSRIADFGLFVDMGGVDGLVHISEISWHRAEKLAESFEIGQQVTYVVLKIDRKEPLRNTKISLSIKQVGADPWTTVSENFHVGDQVAGKITRLASFGAFVELTPGIEGLIHVSEMSWTKRVNHPQEVVNPGDQVNVTILSIDENKRTVSCSLKDVANDPWNKVSEMFSLGSLIKGTVASQSRFGYFVNLTPGITGLLVFANIAADKKGSIKVGDEIEVTIERLEIDTRRIGLSMGVSAQKADEEFARAFIQSEEKKKPVEKPVSDFGEALKKALKKG